MPAFAGSNPAAPAKFCSFHGIANQRRHCSRDRRAVPWHQRLVGVGIALGATTTALQLQPLEWRRGSVCAVLSGRRGLLTQSGQIEPCGLLEKAQPEFGKDRNQVIEDVRLNSLVCGPGRIGRETVYLERQSRLRWL